MKTESESYQDVISRLRSRIRDVEEINLKLTDANIFLESKNKELIESKKIWDEESIKDQKRSAKTINDLYGKNKELINEIKNLKKANENLIIDINSGNIISIQKT